MLSETEERNDPHRTLYSSAGELAGCRAAIGAKEQGDLDVTVLEKAEFPRKRRHRVRATNHLLAI